MASSDETDKLKSCCARPVTLSEAWIWPLSKLDSPHASSGDDYLVAGTDGVGTKLKLVFETGNHDTIGIDLVAMSVNDIVTYGCEAAFLLRLLCYQTA